ncbi:MAG: RagB/SusD family nutrient uptake outer membrane protein [Ginsengibacter sp.]
MKKMKFCLAFIAISFLLAACQKASILDKAPPNQYTDATLWSDIGLADAYLLDAYHGTKMGYSEVMLTAATDNSYGYGTDVYVQGNITPENFTPWGGSLPYWNDYFNDIQKINVFLQKIDGVVNSYPEAQQADIRAKAQVMKGEAYFLRAFCYSQLVRMYGGVPLASKPYELGEDFSKVKRASFEETINFIAGDCDSAANLLLTKDQMTLGRATKGAALALKSRVLLFAASDLTADGSAANKYVGYENPDRNALWTAARDAAKAVIDLGTYKLENFGAPDQAAVAQNYFNFFKAHDLSSSEIIWGKMYSLSSGDKNLMNQWDGANSWLTYDQGGWGYNAPSQNLVDSYEMKDGSKFSDNFTVDGDGYYHNNSSTFHHDNIYYDRDPRFYGSILYDSAIWAKRTGALASIDPLGIYDRRTRITINGGNTTTRYGLDSRQSSVNNFNSSQSGYVLRKMLDNDATTKVNDNIWIEIRYAEVLLNYAEACMELGETSEAATYINMIRNRAGMPDFTGDIKEALRYERRIELAFENSRWYDIRRWKILDKALTNSLGIVIVETNTNGNVSTTWQQIVTQPRGPVSDKMYWLPIPSTEMKKAPQLVQNPGY